MNNTILRQIVLGAALASGWAVLCEQPLPAVEDAQADHWYARSFFLLQRDHHTNDIPLGMCLNATIPNLAVVGRCASSTRESHSSVRVQTHTMVMGQRTCAALALAADVDLAQFDVRKLQTQLRKEGVYLEEVP